MPLFRQFAFSSLFSFWTSKQRRDKIHNQPAEPNGQKHLQTSVQSVLWETSVTQKQKETQSNQKLLSNDY